MTPISRLEIVTLLEALSLNLNDAGFDYLVYGSVAFSLVTGDNCELHDLDIVVSESDFSALASLLKHKVELHLKPIMTPVTIHANSLIHEGHDGKPFDVSLDSFEHYFQPSGFDLLRCQEYGPARIKLMTRDDLILAYNIGLRGANDWKLDDYKRKLATLRTMKAL